MNHVIKNQRADHHSNPPNTMAERQRQRFIDKVDESLGQISAAAGRITQRPGWPWSHFSKILERHLCESEKRRKSG